MKPFNLEEAKAGKPVCTRSGEEVEILKWDARGEYPIIGYVKEDSYDVPMNWSSEGVYPIRELCMKDLMMASHTYKGWIIMYGKISPHPGAHFFKTEQEAIEFGKNIQNDFKAVYVEWEE